jgi:hypothetical protein
MLFVQRRNVAGCRLRIKSDYCTLANGGLGSSQLMTFSLVAF